MAKVTNIKAANQFSSLASCTRLYQIKDPNIDNESLAEYLGLKTPSPNSGDEIEQCAFFSDGGVLAAFRVMDDKIAIYKQCGMQHDWVLEVATEIKWE